jgi:serine/threonine protein phosphatase PrpC
MVATWQVISTSVIGASHLLKAKPNQDAIRHYQAAQGCPVIVAVADGHGGEKYTHSDWGSKFAVKAAITVLKDTFKNEADFSLSQIKRLAEDDIPKAIVRSWQEKVDEYCLKRQDLNDHHKYRYFGTTLLVALVLSRCIVYWQLGDGDIVLVWDNHEVSRPIAADSRLLGNETTSLCGKTPWFDFRVCFQPIVESKPPRFILLSTDGYSNSYPTNADFEQTVLDIALFVENEGYAWVRQQLPAWLAEASKQGSGDDISVGVIYLQSACFS